MLLADSPYAHSTGHTRHQVATGLALLFGRRSIKESPQGTAAMAPPDRTEFSDGVSAGTAHGVVAETARAASTLGHEMADIAGTIEDTMKLAKSQSERFAEVGVDVAEMVRGNESIRDEARATGETAKLTRERVEQALDAAV